MEENIKLIEDPQDIRLNENQEIQQILGAPPGWILRWGITLIFLVAGVLLFLSWVVKYPDVIQAPVVITTENPPIRVFTRTSGKIKQLMVQPQDRVKANDLLAVMETPANFDDIKILDDFLKKYNNNSSVKDIRKLELPQNLELGPIQNAFSALVKKLDEYRYVSSRRTIQKKVETLDEQIQQLKSLNASLENQKGTLQKVVDLARQNLDRNKELLAEKVASKRDVENAETSYLESKRQLESMNSDMINNNVRIEQLSLEIIQTEQSRKDRLYPGFYEIQEQIEGLKSEIENWQQQFLIRAPISGMVEMDEVWSSNQFLNEAEEVLTIVPNDVSNKVVCKGYLPIDRSGKVETGMAANIRFAAYPYQEYGVYNTRVSYIAGVPQEEGYIVEFAVATPMVTSYDEGIPFRQEMRGVARIVTEDRRILDRIFDRVVSAVKNRDEDPNTNF